MARRRRATKAWRLPNKKVLSRMPAEALCEALVKSGAALPLALEEAIVACGAEAVAPLVAALRDREIWWRQVDLDTPTPVYAAQLLSKIGDPAALAPMLGVLIDTAGLYDWESLHKALLHAIKGFGAAALEPTLAARPSASEDAEQEAILEVLAGLGVHDVRVHFLLLEQLRTAPELGAPNLVAYADPEGALEALSEALAALPIHAADSDEPNDAFIEIAWAISELGGELAPEQERRLAAVHAIERQRSVRLRAEVAELELERDAYRRVLDRSRSTTGRNQACWCGSGEKYKRCHWAQDRRGGPEEPGTA